jgi:CSLREA domain-containing protein
MFMLLTVAVFCPSANAATITVNGLGDTLNNDGVCTIREAIINANNDAATWTDCVAGSGSDIINLPAGTITLSVVNAGPQFAIEDFSVTGDLDVRSSMTINGNSAGTTINAATIDRIFDINPDDNDPTSTPPLIVVDINDLTITNGRQNDTGGLRVNLNATATLDNSTVSNSTAAANDGGGVGNFGTLTITNSTVSGNFALLLGGGISNFGTLSLVSCTVTNNDSSFNNLVGGIANTAGTTTLRNTIVAGNQGVDEPNLRGSFISAGYNVIGEFGTNLPLIAPTTGDQFDVSDASVLLGPLTNNGGPTSTHALGVGSLAIDKGHTSSTTSDQRGLPRPCDLADVANATGGDGADVGSFEVQGACVTNTAPVAVNNEYTIDQDTPLTPAAPGVLGNDTDADADTLTAALVSSPTHAATFTFNADGSFSYTPTASFTGVDSFTYKANDGTEDSNVATVTINVLDTEPPVITASVGTDTLWSPNHNLVNVGLSVSVTDNSDGPIDTDITVFSNEDDIFPASGNHSPDAREIAAGTLKLRSERAGNGSGRIYLILIVATDPSGNESRECLTVVVPKSQSSADIAAVNAAAAAAAAFCEANGAPPAGYFVVGDGPIVGSKLTRNVLQISSADPVRPVVGELIPQRVIEQRVTFQSGPTTVVGFFKGLETTSAEDFSVKEYDEFHRVLHPLEHEALPKNDMATIRRRANELIKLGDAIVKLGVPAGTKSESVENFKKELEKFKEALVKYGSDAESGSDADLKKSYSAVHDSFEELAGMLPRK